MQHHEAFETDRLSRIALENLMGSELLALDRIARPAKKLKALNSAGVALRAGTQVREHSESHSQKQQHVFQILKSALLGSGPINGIPILAAM